MLSESPTKPNRRSLLKTGLAAGAAFAAQSTVSGQTATGQGSASANPAARQNPNYVGKKFRAWVSRGFGANTTTLQELKLLPITGRQVLIRTEVTQCCYTMAGRMLGTQDPPDPNGPQAAPVINDPRQPLIQGHGGVGIVEAVGPDVRRVQVGDRVIVAVTPQCGVCYHCLRGRADRCQFLAGVRTVAVAEAVDGTKIYQAGNIGGMADYMIPYEESVVPVFSNAPSVELAMLHCVGGCGLGTTMTLSPVEPGSDVVVFGGGPVGLSAVQGARIMGASNIILVEPIRARRELGLKIGATHAFDPNAEGNNLVPKIKDLCKGPTDRKFAGGRDWTLNAARIGANIGPDLVVEAVGYDRAKPKLEAGPDPTGILPLQQVWQVCPTGGHICTTGVGFPPQATIAFPVNQWTNGSKTHHSSQYGGVNMMRDLPRQVRLIEKGLYDAKSLITSKYLIEKAMDAYHDVADRTTVTAMIMMG
jgi:S-(hydroxymethyl)glutathione dehydrogenase / alcohol dehydrogenase